ncbi:MAG: molybdenum cofactor biosynthesis protein MoaE [Rhodospirillaceae bacterium]|nr:molybdenum cofactor biosynthesis protein MoaE [Rhodospirillaceae bacterium]
MGAGAGKLDFEVTDRDIDVDALQRGLDSEKAGAYAAFQGWVRNHNDGRDVVSLEYEAYRPIAVSEGERVLAEALQRFNLLKVAASHRVGHLQIGDCAVWVGVSAAHRGDAFDGCRYVIDELKSRLPIWKKEHYAGGDSGWINCVTGQPRKD